MHQLAALEYMNNDRHRDVTVWVVAAQQFQLTEGPGCSFFIV